MDDMTNTVTLQVKPTRKSHKIKKSNVVDDALKDNLTNKEIILKVQEVFPDATSKSIRNLISVRRSRLKKQGTTTTNVVTLPLINS